MSKVLDACHQPWDTVFARRRSFCFRGFWRPSPGVLARRAAAINCLISAHPGLRGHLPRPLHGDVADLWVAQMQSQSSKGVARFGAPARCGKSDRDLLRPELLWVKALATDSPFAAIVGLGASSHRLLPTRRDEQERTVGLSSLASVAVVHSSQQRQGDDLALVRRFDGAWLRTILLQSSMGAMAVKIIEVIGQHAV